MKLSVVVPTYNRAGLIRKSINTIYQQTLAVDQYEVLVIDDGSTDGTREILQKLREKYGFRLYLQDNSGPAAARNRGIRQAHHAVIVFIQDDIVVTESFLDEHLKFHQKYNRETTGVVGFTTWHPELQVTPFMHWLEHGGPQFDYDRLQGKTRVDHLAFYTSNLSLRRSFLLDNNYLDENFFGQAGVTAYEDTEWGWRLMKEGLELFYNPDARAYHHHQQDLERVSQRRFHMGRLSHLLSKKHPEIKMSGESDSFWHSLTHLKSGFLSDEQRFKLTRLFLNRLTIGPVLLLARFCEKRFYCPLIFKLACGYFYNQGYRQGRKEFSS